MAWTCCLPRPGFVEVGHRAGFLLLGSCAKRTSSLFPQDGIAETAIEGKHHCGICREDSDEKCLKKPKVTREKNASQFLVVRSQHPWPWWGGIRGEVRDLKCISPARPYISPAMGHTTPTCFPRVLMGLELTRVGCKVCQKPSVTQLRVILGWLYLW